MLFRSSLSHLRNTFRLSVHPSILPSVLTSIHPSFLPSVRPSFRLSVCLYPLSYHIPLFRFPAFSAFLLLPHFRFPAFSRLLAYSVAPFLLKYARSGLSEAFAYLSNVSITTLPHPACHLLNIFHMPIFFFYPYFQYVD